MAGKAVWAVAVVLSAAVAAAFAYALWPAETLRWLSIMAASVTPSPSRLAAVLPLTILWMLAVKASDWLDRRVAFKGSWVIKVPAFLALLSLLPIIINCDVIAETLWRARFSAAFAAYADPGLSLGLWRVLLATFAIALLAHEGSTEVEVKNAPTWFGVLLFICVASGFIGEFVSLPIKPSGNPQDVANSVWVAGRYMALGCAYTFASVIGVFAGFMQPHMAGTLTWGMLGAFAGAAAYLAAAVTVAGCAGNAFHIALLSLNAKIGVKIWGRTGGGRTAGGVRGDEDIPSTGLFMHDGHVYATVCVAGPDRNAGVIFRTLMVDTGASYTILPERMLKKLGVKPTGTCILSLSDGRQIKRETGCAIIECLEKRAVAPVVFGKGGDAEVLGITAVRELGLLEEVGRLLSPRRFRVSGAADGEQEYVV